MCYVRQEVNFLEEKIITYLSTHRNIISKDELAEEKEEIVVPEKKDAMNKFKMEVANEVGVNLKQGYNGDLTSRQAGSIGGNMVKKMIEQAENQMANK